MIIIHSNKLISKKISYYFFHTIAQRSKTMKSMKAAIYMGKKYLF